MYYKKIGFFLILFILLWGKTGLSEQVFSPSPKQSKLSDNYITIGSNSPLTIPDDIMNRYRSAVQSVKSYIKSLKPQKKDITITVKVHGGQGADKSSEALSHNEGYLINISSDNVTITGKDPLGALYGLTLFEALMRKNEGKIRVGEIASWPDLKIRALHIVLRGQRPADLRQQITMARFGHYNALIVQIKDNVRFKTMERVASRGAQTKDVFLDVLQFARENGLEIVPELRLLTHQEKLFKESYPHLMFNRATYDPKKDETYTIIFSMIDEVINAINPKAIHIGHDELAGLNPKSRRKWLGKGDEPLPKELFLADVRRLHQYLKSQGIETWMWGDMLIAPHEFPTMEKKHLHGLQGYSEIRDEIPKEIVICDWHYLDEQPEFPSALAFARNGHRVLGATWKKEKTIKNFSQYIANMPDGGEGMIATTWFGALKGDTNALHRIIRVSAEAFWNAK
ncbi:MAG: hypothetical protein E3K32_13520 [wastewater metagenome]|nr:hypothetical protein [Candidatus Loosdrechtia aerotolerans]